MIEEEFLKIKVRYNAPVLQIIALVFAPLIIIAGQLSSTAAVVMAVVVVVLSWLLEMGTPPIYEVALMVFTTLIPVGFPMYNLFVDGRTGAVELINIFELSQKSKIIGEEAK